MGYFKKSNFLIKAFAGLLSGFMFISLTHAQIMSSDYNRIGITYVNHSVSAGSYKDAVMNAFDKNYIPSKYDDNRIDLGLANSFANYTGSIKTGLQQKGIANEVIDLLFAEQNGAWSMDKLIERAKYNLTDAEVIALEAQFKGMERGVQDAQWSETLIKNSYIVALNYKNFRTLEEIGVTSGLNEIAAAMAEKQQAQGKKVEKQESNLVGLGVTVGANVYKIVINDAVLNSLYTLCWADESSSPEEIAKAVSARKSMIYELEHVGYFETDKPIISTMDKKNFTGDYTPIIQNLIQPGIRGFMQRLERKSGDFNVKSGIFSVESGGISSKVTAKIGYKEGLSNQDRYYVYENVQKSNGKLVERFRGVIRAKKVANNRNVADGQSVASEFIQISGSKLDRGMKIVHKPDFYGLSFAATYGSKLGVVIKGEWLLSKFADKGHGLNLYLDLTEDNEAEGHPGTVGFGLAQDINLGRVLVLQPHFGARYYGMDELEEKALFGVDGGASIGLNFAKKMQAFVTIGGTNAAEVGGYTQFGLKFTP